MSYCEVSNRPLLPQSTSYNMTENAEAKTYPTSVTEFSAILVQAQKESLSECAIMDTPPSSLDMHTAIDTNKARVSLKKAHTCGSLFAKCGCNYDNCTLLQTFSRPITENSYKRSFEPVIQNCCTSFPKRLSNPEINERNRESETLCKVKSNIKREVSLKQGYLKHPDIPYPVENPRESRGCDKSASHTKKRSVSSSNKQFDFPDLVNKKVEDNLNYHKYTALTYGNFDSSDPAHKFLKEFGIFGPMGNETSVNRRNSRVSFSDSDGNPQHKQISKIMCLETNRKKSTGIEEEYELSKLTISRLEKEIKEVKTEFERIRRALNKSESEVLKLQRENHKLKVTS